MDTKTTPQTVRLTPKATAALIQLESKRPGIRRAKIVEEALEEAAITPERLPISAEELICAAYIYKYLCAEANAYGSGAKKDMEGAGQTALSAKTTALFIKKVCLEAKGRISISRK